ncbi:MAG: NADH-quinone oxidoreductase subunit NuoH [Acidimicrobiia bacterium]|nr:NADH-quinone oxidoreductase subunit NuoH [Acidimicrobiia bacterium]MYC58066.1 NADH-quinone oxidoreductase subunit NuoH [Acidimicrobiia bacterium]MYG93805.1 NADH-quinone oxidoreductase subunit NuoH [Acidimicrobiia bacterium]MYI30761.1 NADH-quinone oxidoreductase subunit NuoH [Acidimicrobiia bacterium]
MTPAFLQSLTGAVLALEVPYWVSSAIKLGLVALVIPTAALMLGYVFLLKMMSFMQSRLGPMEAGPYGSLQLLADGVKFLQKEDIFPEKADRTVFALAPLVVLISTFLIYVVIPAGPDAVVAQLDVGIFYALAVSSLSVVGILMAGWASANKYALMGGLRAAGQLIAYELPLVLAVMGVVIQAGTLDLQKIVTAQAHGEIFGWGGIGNPFILTQFVGFFIFLVAVQAELTQPPFDMPVAESEIVGGYQVEYTGFRFLFFFMGEFGTAFAFAALAAVMFLGGWALPWGDLTHWGFNIAGPVILLIKTLAVATLIFWFRFTYPRLREDQLQRLAWKFLIPLSLVNIVVTGIFKVAL